MLKNGMVRDLFGLKFLWDKMFPKYEIPLESWPKKDFYSGKTFDVAVLFIATGRYITFWKDFYESCQRFFLPNHHVTYFLFTDSDIPVPENVVKVPHKWRGWPDETLMRWDTFLKVEKELEKFDFIYFINGTMVPVAPIGEEIFPTPDQKLMVVLHPGFYKRPRHKFTYDENPKSLAYIPKTEGKYYFMGGFNGGCSKDFLKLIHDLNKATLADRKNGIVALWHDESHLNKYMLDKAPLILTSEYGFPERVSFNKKNLKVLKDIKMIIKDKSNPKYGGHDWLRGMKK